MAEGFTVAVLRVFTVAGASRVFMAVTIFSAVVVFLVRVSVSMATGTRGGIGIIPIPTIPITPTRTTITMRTMAIRTTETVILAED